MLLVLPNLWVPMLKGLLQGQHRFGGLGWLQIIDGIGRFGAVLIAVVLLHLYAAGAIFAALVGQIITLILGAWLTRDSWMRSAGVSFAWQDWARTAIPLTLGMGSIITMQSIDTLYVQNTFAEEQTALYVAAMLTGFAIIQFIAPITVVMFPKIVRSKARAETSDAMAMTLAVTAGFCALAAIGCTLLPKLPLQIIYFSRRDMWEAAPLVPWFAWALMPQILANVLIQNLLAHGKFKAVIGIVLVPILCTGTLIALKPTLLQLVTANPQNPLIALQRVIQLMGAFNLVLFAIAAWFTFGQRKISVSDPGSAAAR
jgi:O-antigen/teichoic acid export membrane protein